MLSSIFYMKLWNVYEEKGCIVSSFKFRRRLEGLSVSLLLTPFQTRSYCILGLQFVCFVYYFTCVGAAFNFFMF